MKLYRKASVLCSLAECVMAERYTPLYILDLVSQLLKQAIVPQQANERIVDLIPRSRDSHSILMRDGNELKKNMSCINMTRIGQNNRE